MLKWYIKNKDGRYCHFKNDSEGTILLTRLKAMAHIFSGTRDLVDGICMGLKLGTGVEFEPEQLIYTQKPSYEHEETTRCTIPVDGHTPA